jgi:hypothetical protein
MNKGTRHLTARNASEPEEAIYYFERHAAYGVAFALLMAEPSRY